MKNIDGAVLRKLGELCRLVQDALSSFTPASLQKIIEQGGEWKKGIRKLVLELGGQEAVVAVEESEKPPVEISDAAYRRQTWTLIWRWAMFTAFLTAIFWGVWYAIAGEIPTVEKVLWSVGEKGPPVQWLQLPFAISRWWDVMLAPVWSSMIILIFRTTTDKAVLDSVGVGLGVGLVAGLVAGLGVGLGAGLVVGFYFGLCFGLVAGLVAGLVVGLVGLIVSPQSLLRSFGKWLAGD